MKVGERGQVTIPAELRRCIGIVPGDRLEFKEDSGKLVARRVLDDDVFDAVAGTVDRDLDTDGLIEQMRGERWGEEVAGDFKLPTRKELGW